ncbi:sucrose operon repressor ScrR, LacI family [Lachnospiraceae bacterium KM106-2]|nr:sucrose operon repressor ScrR, LacI family [Lachnospiraceae bacterium KM106-2]
MTINEIAKMAGVSRATVSRYLNDGYVSEEKKLQIKKVIEETGYIPSMQAQNLRSKKTNLIGVIIPKINSESISEMVSGISSVLSKEGYQLLLADTENNEKEEVKYLRLFSENQVDGIILIGTILTANHKKLMKELQVPIIVLGQKVEGYSCVYQDDYHAAKEITEHLLCDASKVGYIGVTPKDVAVGKQRKKGFIKALEEKGLKESDAALYESQFTVDSGYEAAKQMFKEMENIDSIFCATDTIALGAMMYLQEKKIAVPGQVQVIGIGDSVMSRVNRPQLSTVHFHLKESGMEAANMLISMLSQDNPVEKQVRMGYEVILRDSLRKK